MATPRTWSTGNPTTQGPIKYTLPVDFDNSSGSKFEPIEDEDNVEEDELEEEVDAGRARVGRELASVGSTSSTSSKPNKKVKVCTHDILRHLMSA